MPTNILMPALSPTMEKGNLARWLKKEGDKIKSGDVIAEIETDKATMEYEAVDEGTLAKIVVPEGTQDVAVNSVIAVLAGEGEDVKAAASAAKAAASAAKAAPTKAPEKKAEVAPATTKPSPQRQEAPRDAPPKPSSAPQARSRRQKRPPKPSKSLTAIVSFRLRWRAALRRRPASISAVCRAQVRTAV